MLAPEACRPAEGQKRKPGGGGGTSIVPSATYGLKPWAGLGLLSCRRVVQGVVVRNEGVQNRTERTPRLAPRKSVLGKSPMAFVIIKGIITGLLESQAQICDAQAGAPFVEGQCYPPVLWAPVTALDLRECTRNAAVGAGCVHSALHRSKRGPSWAGSGCPAFSLPHLCPPPFSRTSWFTAPKYRPFPTLELFSRLRGTGVARTFLFFNRLMMREICDLVAQQIDFLKQTSAPDPGGRWPLSALLDHRHKRCVSIRDPCICLREVIFSSLTDERRK